MQKNFPILLLLLISGCRNKDNSEIPEIFKTNYGKFTPENPGLRYGDLIKIKNTPCKGVVCDISKDEGGIWYGIIFMNTENNLFGRNIPGGFSYDCLSLFDLTYLHEKGLEEIEKIESLELNFKKIGIGARSTAINRDELLRDFARGIENRKKIETPCEQKIKILQPVNENYRNLHQILK